MAVCEAAAPPGGNASAPADERSGQADKARETVSSRDGNDGRLASLDSSASYAGYIPPATRRWMKHKATLQAVQALASHTASKTIPSHNSSIRSRPASTTLGGTSSTISRGTHTPLSGHRSQWTSYHQLGTSQCIRNDNDGDAVRPLSADELRALFRKEHLAVSGRRPPYRSGPNVREDPPEPNATLPVRFSFQTAATSYRRIVDVDECHMALEKYSVDGTGLTPRGVVGNQRGRQTSLPSPRSTSGSPGRRRRPQAGYIPSKAWRSAVNVPKTFPGSLRPDLAVTSYVLRPRSVSPVRRPTTPSATACPSSASLPACSR